MKWSQYHHLLHCEYRGRYEAEDHERRSCKSIRPRSNGVCCCFLFLPFSFLFLSCAPLAHEKGRHIDGLGKREHLVQIKVHVSLYVESTCTEREKEAEKGPSLAAAFRDQLSKRSERRPSRLPHSAAAPTAAQSGRVLLMLATAT